MMNKVDEILALIDEGLATAEAVEKEFGRVPERGDESVFASQEELLASAFDIPTELIQTQDSNMQLLETRTLRIPEVLREELNAYYNQLLLERLLPNSITIRPHPQGDIMDGIMGLYRDEMERRLLLNYDGSGDISSD